MTRGKICFGRPAKLTKSSTIPPKAVSPSNQKSKVRHNWFKMKIKAAGKTIMQLINIIWPKLAPSRVR